MVRQQLRDLASIWICVLAWGTSWYVITLQLGTVDAIASLAYRFALAAAVLFVWCGCRNEAIGLSVEQHKAALGVGLFKFTIDYGFTSLGAVRQGSPGRLLRQVPWECCCCHGARWSMPVPIARFWRAF